MDAGGPAPDDSPGAREPTPENAALIVDALLQAAPVGMALIDRSLRFVQVNAALAAVNGLPVADHLGRRVADVLTGLPPEVIDDIRSVFATGHTIAHREVVGTTPAAPAQERHWIVGYYPVGPVGEVLWVGTTVMEVTAWRHAEADRARALAAERLARRAAEQAAGRLARLQVLTARLAGASEGGTVAELAVTAAGEAVGATGAALLTVVGDHLHVMASTGMDPVAVATYRWVPLDADVPAADAARRRELVLLQSLAERDRAYPSMAGVPAANRAFAAVPLVADGDVIGCLAFAWADERGFPDGDRQFLLALGRQVAQALDRARLYEAERRARAVAVEVSERMRFLAEASRVLSSSLDYQVTLSDLAGLAVPAVADACAVLLRHGTELRLVVAAHVDPERQSQLAAAVGRRTHRRGPVLLGRVAVTGESLVFGEVPDRLWEDMAEDEAHLAELRGLGVQSAAVVALRARGRVLGVLALASLDGGRVYDEDDLPFVEDLAGRAAVAIDNARSHTERGEVARTLQRSLLPASLPRIPGVELAQGYHPMGAAEVGGDFLEVFPLGDGRWGVSMGDVCGKGVGAASLTALARYTVRAAATVERRPEPVLRLLNRTILDTDVGERFCTIAHAVVTPGPASVRVTLACGGHPLPFLVSADGSVCPVGRPGTVIGLFEDIDVDEVDLVLAPGDALVLYTDGLTEVRNPQGEFAPDLLEDALRESAGGTAQSMVDVVERRVRAYEGGFPRDDTALLVVKSTGAPPA